MLEIVGTIFAIYILLAVAFPHVFIPMPKLRRKKCGSTYWGVYSGVPTEDLDNEPKIESPEPIGRERVVAGSSMYAMGKGVSMKR